MLTQLLQLSDGRFGQLTVETFIILLTLVVLKRSFNQEYKEVNQKDSNIESTTILWSELLTLIAIFLLRILFESMKIPTFFFVTLAEINTINQIVIFYKKKKATGSNSDNELLSIKYYLKSMKFNMFIVLWVAAIVNVSVYFLNLPILTKVRWGFLFLALSMIIFQGLTLIVNALLPNHKKYDFAILRYCSRRSVLWSSIIWSAQLTIFGIFGLFSQNYIFLSLRAHLSLIPIYLILLTIFLRQEKQKIEKDYQQMALEVLNESENPDENQTQSINFTEFSTKNEILNINNLKIYFYTEQGTIQAIDGVSFKIFDNEILGLVGETGCGKSLTALSIMQMVPSPGEIISGQIYFKGEDLLEKKEEEMLNYRGNQITMIFQDPLNSLNPVYTIGNQFAEVFLLHKKGELLAEVTKHPEKGIESIAREWCVDMLKEVNIPDAEQILDRYPYELSGGMRQRVMIAMALSCEPELLLADEPTTALDVTIQAQILNLMKKLRKKYKTAILFITHDLGVVSKMCDRVAVMYSGHIVEYGKVSELFKDPIHPYTKGLLGAIPKVQQRQSELNLIPGTVPNLLYPPKGCRFHPRCEFKTEKCASVVPKQVEIRPNYFVACHLFTKVDKDPSNYFFAQK